MLLDRKMRRIMTHTSTLHHHIPTTTPLTYPPYKGEASLHSQPVGHCSQLPVLIRSENTADNSMALHIVTIKTKSEKYAAFK